MGNPDFCKKSCKHCASCGDEMDKDCPKCLKFAGDIDMNERTFTTEFVKRNDIAGCFEIKFTSKKSIPFKAVQEHQEAALLAASSREGLSWKISDSPFFKDPKGRMRFTHKKNFDVIRISCLPGYVVLVFWIARKRKNVYYIHIKKWIELREQSSRKSITEETAYKSAYKYENYLKK